jgi:hypothetical protein
VPLQAVRFQALNGEVHPESPDGVAELHFDGLLGVRLDRPVKGLGDGGAQAVGVVAPTGVAGMQTFSVGRFRERNYEPGLLEKRLGYNRELPRETPRSN